MDTVQRHSLHIFERRSRDIEHNEVGKAYDDQFTKSEPSRMNSLFAPKQFFPIESDLSAGTRSND